MRCNRGYNLINYKGVTTLGREGGLNHNGTTSHRTTNMQHKPQLQIIMAMQLRYLDGGLIFFSTIIILSMNSEFLQMSMVNIKVFFDQLAIDRQLATTSNKIRSKLHLVVPTLG